MKSQSITTFILVDGINFMQNSTNTSRQKVEYFNQKVQTSAPLQTSPEPFGNVGQSELLKNTIRTFVGKSGEQRVGLENLDAANTSLKTMFLTLINAARQEESSGSV